MPAPYGQDTSPPIFDPWASSSSATPSQATFASALRHKHAGSTDSTVGLRPAYRRRGSDSTLGAEEGHVHRSKDRASAAHGRSRTVDHRGERHPLVAGSTSSSSNLGITRPRLDRLLSGEIETTSTARDSKKVDRVTTPEPARRGREEEKTVMVHQVQPSDTLSGVALKYNVALAELRKANKLWSQDSIHLRKILYIPLDKSAQMKLLLPDLPEITSPVSSTATADDLPVRPRRASSPKLPSSEIRRVPASELSFFPPPASSALRHTNSFSSSSRSSSGSRANTLPRGFNPGTLTSSASSASPFFPVAPSTSTNGGGGAATLSSLFNAIPRVPISLPRPLAARVSSESARISSSPSAASEDQEHELENVGLGAQRTWALAPIARPPTRGYAPPDGGDRSSAVRTAQPSPSPAMHVPRGSPAPAGPAPKGNLARRLAVLSESAVR